MDITVRQALYTDRARIEKLNKSAVKNKKKLIKALQGTREYVKELFLVAEVDNVIVGYLMFYPVYIKSRKTKYKTLSLIEMTIHPDYKKEGIGKKLIEEGIKCSQTMGFFSIVTSKTSEYYEQFGFKPASRYSIRQTSSSASASFMVLELVAGALDDIPGKVEYPEAYHKAS
ncbi:GNAT family N-acetyltransferase [Elusimicrobiota bacterium]